jgi:DNA-binding XRE family transcriptional regulator
MTQAEPAERIGIIRQTVPAIAADRSTPSREMAGRIARMSGVRRDAAFAYPEDEAAES